jgi:hypothetical protein
VEASLSVRGVAWTNEGKEKLDPPETAYSEAYAATIVKLTGKLEAVEVANNPLGNKRAVAKKTLQNMQNAGFVGASGSTPSTSKESTEGEDPLVLSIYDVATGDLVAEEALYNEHWLADGPAMAMWDDIEGLVLGVRPGGTASVDFDTTSAWVLNPLDGSATLTESGLALTGDLAALAWDLFTDSEGRLFAVLPLSELSNEVTFLIQLPIATSGPEGLDLVLSMDQKGRTDMYLTEPVPEPGTLILLALGLAGTARFRTRN